MNASRPNLAPEAPPRTTKAKVLSIVKAVRDFHHWRRASGGDRLRMLRDTILGMGRIGKTQDISGATHEIGQFFLAEGYTFEEIAAVTKAVAEDNAAAEYANSIGSKLFNPDDPKRADAIKRMVALTQAPGALFFLVMIAGEGRTLSTPFVNSSTPAIINGETVGSIDSMAAHARREAGRNVNVFLTTNSFASPYYLKDGRKLGYRKSENLAGSRTLTVDLDVKEGAYQNRQEALADLARVVVAGALPEPTLVVNSGHGAHAWWVVDRDLPADEWRSLSRGFARLLSHYGLKFDQQCTVNPTGILRMPGTGNFKRGGRLAVTLDHVAIPAFCSAADILDAVADIGIQLPRQGRSSGVWLDVEGKPVPRSPRPARRGKTENFAAGIEDDAVDLADVVAECPMLLDAFARGGDGDPEPLWRQKLLLAHFSTDLLGNAHALSRGDPRYTPEETENKLETITDQQAREGFGWPSCAKFADLSSYCKTCRHRDEGKSPLNFGRLVHGQDPAPTPQLGANSWLADACRSNGVIVAGRYHGQLLPRNIERFANRKNSGVSFYIQITEGPFQGYECHIAMTLDGSPERVVRRDLGVVAAWVQLLGVGPTKEAVETVIALGRAGEHQTLVFDIGVDQWNGVALFLKRVEKGGNQRG